MWTCTSCSYAYNKVEAAKCEVCSLARQVTKEEPLVENGGETPGNGAQMVNTELIKVSFSFKFSIIIDLLCYYSLAIMLL